MCRVGLGLRISVLSLRVYICGFVCFRSLVVDTVDDFGCD